MSDKHSKTEMPTPKRLRDAKKKGQVAKSSELVPAVSLVAFAMTAMFLAKMLLTRSLAFVKSSLSTDFGMTINQSMAKVIVGKGIGNLLITVLPYITIAFLLGIIVNVAQVGFMFTLFPLKPDIKRINPIEGFKNLFSKKAVFNLAKSLAKLILVFYLAYKALSGSVPKIMNAGEIGTEKLFLFFVEFVKDMVIDIGFVMLGLAAVDYVFQRKEFIDNQKMTKQEIKDEYKEMEGNPEVRQKRMARQRQIAMSRMMANIPQSDVVITNPTHLAVAIRYDKDKDSAPIVMAKGADHLAAKIREMAKENKIPVMENKELARAIYAESEVGEYIPIELYQAVAEILALVYRLKEMNKRKI